MDCAGRAGLHRTARVAFHHAHTDAHRTPELYADAAGGIDDLLGAMECDDQVLVRTDALQPFALQTQQPHQVASHSFSAEQRLDGVACVGGCEVLTQDQFAREHALGLGVGLSALLEEVIAPVPESDGLLTEFASRRGAFRDRLAGEVAKPAGDVLDGGG